MFSPQVVFALGLTNSADSDLKDHGMDGIILLTCEVVMLFYRFIVVNVVWCCVYLCNHGYTSSCSCTASEEQVARACALLFRYSFTLLSTISGCHLELGNM